MQESADMSARLDEISGLLDDKLGASGRDVSVQLQKVRRRFPRRLRPSLALLQDAAPMADNPRMAQVLDDPRYDKAASDIITHLSRINLSERRKSWWLGMLGGMAFNLLAVLILFLIALAVLGYV